MAPSRVTRYLGPFWLLVPLLGCADDVELLSTDPTGFHPRPPMGVVGGSASPSGGAPFELGGDANTPGGVPAERGGATNVSGGTTGVSGGTTAASGGTSGAFGDGGDPSAAGDTSSGGSPAAGSGGYAGGGVAGSCGGGGCVACQADAECASGSEWCVQNACVSCATLPDTCPRGSSLMPVLRNGCVGFVCAPSS